MFMNKLSQVYALVKAYTQLMIFYSFASLTK